MNNLISIIIPVKNGEKYIAETIDGIKKQNMNVEILVVDDASTDNTAKLAENLGCKVIKHSVNKGPVVAKNTALKVAKGNYVMFHDADDVMNLETLQKLYDELENNLSVSAVMAKVKDFFSPELSEEEKAKTVLRSDAYYGLFTGAVLIRKSVFDKIGLFNEDVTAGEIIDWQSRMQAHGLEIKKVDFISTNRRIHASNFGKTQANKEFKDYAKILRAKLQGNKDTMTQMIDAFRSTTFKNDRKKLSDEEHRKNVEKLLSGLDAEAYAHAKNLTDKLELAYTKSFVSVDDIYNKKELEQIRQVKEFEKQVKRVDNAYEWNGFKLPLKLFESSVFFYKHGLNFLKNKDYVNGKAIIDGGCFIADSALVFRKEFPDSFIYGFEPLRSNYELAQETIKLNNLKNVKIENLALGDEVCVSKIKTYDTDLKNIESTICPEGNVDINITTIDDYVQKNHIHVGMIKTDVEGFEQKLLAGAKNTICSQKPTLLISIYHNYNDFYKIKPLIESWNLGYKFDFYQGPQNSGDITVETLLIAEIL